ncbi:MFS transporter [Labrys miyagiensis]|uniref:MFS transporter n=2 Tax=Labrys miyagiensis TaxID=346912 RepID=A0ABQ6CGS9_9HYPH|nr:MFS transporter [Labrys miyagiensis]
MRMKLFYGWVIVAVGALMTCVGAGAMFSLAVFQRPMSADTGWSHAGISSAMTLDFLFMGVAGFAWGTASDRFGARPVALAGSALLGLGLALASRAETLLEFQLTYGIIVGIAGGAFFAPMIASVTTWFERNRSLAVSLVSAGIGVAPMTVSPFATWLIGVFGWRDAMLTVGIAAWVLLLPATLLIRPAPLASGEGTSAMQTESGTTSFTAAQAFRTPQFIVLALTFFFCCAAHSGPIFHMVSYAMICGISALAAVSIYSVEGLAGLGGRLLLGVMADRIGVKPVLVAGLLVQALAISAYLYVTRLEQFYLLSLVFGTAYGGVMPLYAVLAREYFGPRIMGTVFGAVTMASSLGMAFGPVAGGWIFDNFNDYRWLYIGSFAVALGAVAVSLAFPPLPSRSREQLQPS